MGFCYLLADHLASLEIQAPLSDFSWYSRRGTSSLTFFGLGSMLFVLSAMAFELFALDSLYSSVSYLGALASSVSGSP